MQKELIGREVVGKVAVAGARGRRIGDVYASGSRYECNCTGGSIRATVEPCKTIRTDEVRGYRGTMERKREDVACMAGERVRNIAHANSIKFLVPMPKRDH